MSVDRRLAGRRTLTEHCIRRRADPEPWSTLAPVICLPEARKASYHGVARGLAALIDRLGGYAGPTADHGGAPPRTREPESG
jgi:hypothetical protein